MELNLQQIKKKLHTLEPEEREAMISLLSTLGITIEYKPRPTIPRILSLGSYHMRRDMQCLTCKTLEQRWYFCTNEHGHTSSTFLHQGETPPPDAEHISIVSTQTAVCRFCDEVLSEWPKEKLINLIKLRRFTTYAEDHRLQYNPRGDSLETGTKPGARGEAIHNNLGAE